MDVRVDGTMLAVLAVGGFLLLRVLQGGGSPPARGERAGAITSHHARILQAGNMTEDQKWAWAQWVVQYPQHAAQVVALAPYLRAYILEIAPTLAF